MADPTPSTANLDALLFKALLDKAADAIYFKDVEGRYLRVSNRMVGTFNMDHPSQVEGKQSKDFFTAEHAEEVLKSEQQIMSSGLPLLNVVEKETWPDESITYADSSKFPIYDDDGKLLGIFGISRDITEQKLAQEQLAAAQLELIEQAKKNAVSEFAGMIGANMGGTVLEITQAVDRVTTKIQAAKKSPDSLDDAQEDLREIRHMVKRLTDLMKM